MSHWSYKKNMAKKEYLLEILTKGCDEIQVGELQVLHFLDVGDPLHRVHLCLPLPCPVCAGPCHINFDA